MKSFKVFLFAILFTGLFAAPRIGSAQAIVDKSNTNHITVNIGGDDVVSTSIQWVFMPSGNMLLKATFQLPSGNPEIPEKGVNKVLALYVGIGFEGGFEATVFSDGRVTLVYHLGNIRTI